MTYSYWAQGENHREALTMELEAKTKALDFYQVNVGELLELKERREPGFIEEHKFEIGVFVGWLLAAITYHTAG